MDSSAQHPASSSRHHRPYFTDLQISMLSEKQRGKISASQEDKMKQLACSFIEGMGEKIGFPRRTVGTAQNLYHRFHLFFPRKDFNYFDVGLSAIYVSSKMHDTLKKPRELLAASYSIRLPEAASRSTGEVDLDRMDPATVEQDRQRLLAVERLMLETVCFNFNSRMCFPYVIKLGKYFGASKETTKMAWRLAADSHRTLVPLQYPPHVIALGGLYLAGLLSSFDPNSTPPRVDLQNTSTVHPLVTQLGNSGDWETKLQAKSADLEEIAHAVIDLLIQFCQHPIPSTHTSPRTPSSPSQSQTPTSLPRAQSTTLPLPYKPDVLMHLKIALRARREDAQGGDEERRRKRQKTDKNSSSSNGTLMQEFAGRVLGKEDETVRFLFGPPRLGGDVASPQ
ncbi:cyclin-like protein [Pterulicium gracile]|uniref:Cyclin-like protein n=1 Tax=Pterulicium gracile TaxID=1884261 RepID=A0A5C3QKI2_9AGAR|nr:cyclin-like protein [Pterula gracilis]